MVKLSGPSSLTLFAVGQLLRWNHGMTDHLICWFLVPVGSSDGAEGHRRHPRIAADKGPGKSHSHNCGPLSGE